MNKYQVAHHIQKELIVLNKIIDRKIIQGRSYIKEASKHQALLRQLRYAGKDYKRTIFNMFLFR